MFHLQRGGMTKRRLGERAIGRNGKWALGWLRV
jgi:hypothetical protein